MTRIQEETVKAVGWKVRFKTAWYVLFARDVFVLGLDYNDKMGYSLRYWNEITLNLLRKHLNQATARLNHICKG